MTVGYFICRAGTQIPHMMYGAVNTTAKELFSGLSFAFEPPKFAHKTGLSAWGAATSHKSPCLLTAVQAHIARPFPAEFAHFFLAFRKSLGNRRRPIRAAIPEWACWALTGMHQANWLAGIISSTKLLTREALVFTVPSVVSGVAKGFSADITPIIGEVSGVVSALLRLSPSEHKQY
ncbi:hypothetical protein C8J57DRAFT_1213090 [Mycena rebaudengoi]|nr:hypothetical protein C8J57DRAFT_1213090 [Mycena rebaudengoi]